MMHLFRNKFETKIMNVIFVIDASENMSRMCIEKVIFAVQRTIDKFTEYNRFFDRDKQIRVSVMKYSSGAEWIVSTQEDPLNVKLPYIITEGDADFGKALSELDSKLSKRHFGYNYDTHPAPFICFITGDFDPCCDDRVIKRLNENPVYKRATKAAAAIGKNVCVEKLISLVGSSDTIVHLTSASILEQVLFTLCSPFLQSDRHLFPACNSETDNTTRSVSYNWMSSYSVSSACDGQAQNNTPVNSADAGTVPPFHPPASYSCSFCGKYLVPGDRFCSRCGNPIGLQHKELRLSRVQFSAVAPKNLMKGEYSVIDIAVYEQEYRNIVDRIIANANGEMREVVSGFHNVSENTEISVTLSSPDIDIVDGKETQTWQGGSLIFSFSFEIPNNYSKKTALFTAAVYFNNIIATRLKFVAECSTRREQKINIMREDVLSAFVSYAREDIRHVASIIQGMKKARPDMDVFFDVESLRSGENWENAIKSEIESRDVLFLCWSPFARASEWVNREWRYALSINGIDSIEPVPLVPPSKCPPPEELKSKHFNDRALLYQINSPGYFEGESETITPRLVRQKTKETIVISNNLFRIGRHENQVDYCIGDNVMISGIHAYIINRKGHFFIFDVNSKNHTYVNGIQIISNNETPIYHLCKIRLADEEFEFLLY